MVEPLLHFAIPFGAMSIAGVRKRDAAFVSLLALAPDLDALFRVHRSMSHSVVVVLLFASAFLVLSLRYPGVRRWIVLGLAGVLSHLALDLFAGYTPILWPVYAYSIWIDTEMMTHIGSSPAFMIYGRVLARPTFFEPFRTLDAPIFTAPGLAVSLLLILPAIVSALRGVDLARRFRNG